ncbi:hypothetical protein [Pararobbsia silviterrae]|uniref:Uncharacterized protein n=1 Tax=Pararobbsia silviterrae TaxID=1792498 RepID=A0A494X989_9BURK|nr:hypothetical protein [Pararobbsia silviterrae]RKP44754.1 hypothetical protein D7S86_27435 [Pararobbsia silviterrae]
MESTNSTRYTVGLNMQCHQVVCKVELIETREPDENGFDCVILSGKIRVLASQNELYMSRKEARAAFKP